MGGFPRTNNAVEGWHNFMTFLLNTVHPNKWKVIIALREKQKLTEVKIKGLWRGK